MKEKILELRAKGYTYNQIVEELGCSKGTVAYHCGEGQKEKTQERNKAYKNHKLIKNLSRFLKAKQKEVYVEKGFIRNQELRLKDKVRLFQYDRKEKISSKSFDLASFLEIYQENPRCYLTGKPIDLYNFGSYHFDHIVPRSKGGENTLENLGLTLNYVNLAKRDMTLEEFLQMCIDVLINFEIISEKNNSL